MASSLNMNTNYSQWVTLDVYLATLLLLLGNTPALKVNANNKVYFRFENTQKLEDDLAAYEAGLTVEAKKFIRELKQLRGQMFDIKEGVR